MFCFWVIASVYCKNIEEIEQECKQICNRMNDAGGNVNGSEYSEELCVSMCVRMLSMKSELLEEKSRREPELLTNCEVPESNCAENSMSTDEIVKMKLKSAEIDSKYIISRIDELKMQSDKNSTESLIVMALEALILVLYLMKPVVMYFIQAKYNAPAPHDGCRRVLDESDIIEAVDKLNAEKEKREKQEKVDVKESTIGIENIEEPAVEEKECKKKECKKEKFKVFEF